MRISRRIALALPAAALALAVGSAHAQDMMKLKIGTKVPIPPSTT